jgi:hypothetical protein
VETRTGKLDLTGKTHEEKRALLAAFVAEQNANPRGTSSAAVDRWLGQMLDDLDAEEMGSIEHSELQRRFTQWLDTAGDVGGPEQEQDPSRPHPAGWHGNRQSK